MHTLLFGLRRADLCSLALQRKLLRSFGITPARYLMLYILSKSLFSLGRARWMFQSDLRRKLGVSAATVSKMLAALERDGLVKRVPRLACDRRQIRVFFSRRARGLLRRVDRQVIRPGVLWLTVYSTFKMVELDVKAFMRWVGAIRKKLEDPATFVFEWCGRTNHPERRWRPAISAKVLLEGGRPA